MDWLAAVEHLRATRSPGALVTVVSVHGHAPREVGAKLVVSADGSWGSIGRDEEEAAAITRARAWLDDAPAHPELISVGRSDGGEVTLLVEPLPVVPSVAVFGIGHVGLELARILARHDLELHLIDSRPDQLAASRLTPLADARARVHVHQVPVLPELVLAELPAGTHVLVMTHDHNEDAALCDAALRTPGLGSIGLIGSSAKWSRFRAKLLEEGHDESALARIKTPIGLDGVTGKDPATIAVSVAADLVRAFERDAASR